MWAGKDQVDGAGSVRSGKGEPGVDAGGVKEGEA